MSFMAGEFPIQLIHVWLISYIQFGSRMFTFFSSSGIRVFIIEIKKNRSYNCHPRRTLRKHPPVALFLLEFGLPLIYSS